MVSARDLAQALSGRTLAFCQRYLGEGRRVGNHWMVGNVHGDRGRSLAVRLKSIPGRAAGKWTDFASSEHGDLLDILRAQFPSADWRQIVDEASAFLGSAPVDPSPMDSAVQRSRPAGQRLFALGRSIPDTPAARYLASRSITRVGPALRYHHSVYFLDADGARRQLPAMLAAITDNGGVVTGCSRTWLDVRTHSLAAIDQPKRVVGALHGNAVRFPGAPSDPDLFAGEGIETVLSIGSALPLAALAACLTANHLAAFQPPAYVRRLFVARDNDDAGMRALTCLRDRLSPCGIDVTSLNPWGNDFNDDLRDRGLAAVRFALAHTLDPILFERLAGAAKEKWTAAG